MRLGVALVVIDTRAVVQALLEIMSGFVRTAKYAIAHDRVRPGGGEYRRRSGWLPFMELAAGTYFLYMIRWATDSYNCLALPFLALFVTGYRWAAFATLYQEYRLRLRWQREQRIQLETAR